MTATLQMGYIQGRLQALKQMQLGHLEGSDALCSSAAASDCCMGMQVDPRADSPDPLPVP